MIKKTTIVPESMSYLMVKRHEYYSLSINGIQYGVIAIRPRGDECQIHMQFTNFNLSAYKQLKKEDWPSMREIIKAHGCKYIFAAYENYKDKKMFKFVKSFGFKMSKIVAISSMEA
jgi:hypothetical protein